MFGPKLQEDKEDLCRKVKSLLEEHEEMKREFSNRMFEERDMNTTLSEDIVIIVNQFRRLKGDFTYFLLTEKDKSSQQT